MAPLSLSSAEQELHEENKFIFVNFSETKLNFHVLIIHNPLAIIRILYNFFAPFLEDGLKLLKTWNKYGSKQI